MANILVTGGAGFIGSHLVEHHLSKGDTVVVIDNLTTGQERNLAPHINNPRLTFHRTSLQDCTALGDIVRTIDTVYHLAAVVGVKQVLKSPLAVLDTNIYAVNYLFKTLLAHRPTARVLVASSSEVYGLQNNVPFKEMDDLMLPSRDPLRWCYAATKYADEMIVYAYAYEHKMNATAIRLFNTSGPRQSAAYGMVLPNFVEKALRGQDIEVFGDGTQTRSFCDVRDITINIGTDEEITITDLAKRVINLSKTASSIRYLSYKEAYGADFVDVKRRRPDVTRLRALTGFQSRYALNDTIHALIEERRKTM